MTTTWGLESLGPSHFLLVFNKATPTSLYILSPSISNADCLPETLTLYPLTPQAAGLLLACWVGSGLSWASLPEKVQLAGPDGGLREDGAHLEVAQREPEGPAGRESPLGTGDMS